jgi:hypothetical protein
MQVSGVQISKQIELVRKSNTQIRFKKDRQPVPTQIHTKHTLHKNLSPPDLFLCALPISHSKPCPKKTLHLDARPNRDLPANALQQHILRTSVNTANLKRSPDSSDIESEDGLKPVPEKEQLPSILPKP